MLPGTGPAATRARSRSVTYAGTDIADEDSDGDGVRDGADDQDHDDIPNIDELSRNAATAARRRRRATSELDARPSTHPTRTAGSTRSTRACRLRSRGPARSHPDSETGAPFDDSPNWYVPAVGSTEDPPPARARSHERALVVKGRGERADRRAWSRPSAASAPGRCSRSRAPRCSPGWASAASPSPTTTARRRPRTSRWRTATSAASSRSAPAYGGSLIMRAPFAMAARPVGRGRARGLPRRRRPVPARGRRARASCSPRRCSPAAPAAGPSRSSSASAPPTRSRCARSTSAIPRSCSAPCSAPAPCSPRCAGARRWPGVLLGLAVANKAWALLAVGPVLLALQADRRRALAIAGAIAVAFMLPLLLAASPSGHPGAARRDRRDLPALAGVVVPRLDRRGDPRRRRAHQGGLPRGPGWLSPISHPLIVVVAVPLSLLAVAPPLGPAAAARAPVRCCAASLDPWNTDYYALPAILALVAWEATRFDRPPLLALAMTMATWATWEWVVPTAAADVEALVYLAWSLPLVAFLGWRLYAPALPRSRRSARAAGRASGAPRSSAR